jgi:CRP/FNR family transcriptional regulator, cyclic AMP receptor protein
MPTALSMLSDLPLFSSLSARQLRKILKSTNEDGYESGDFILRQGGRTQSLFIVLEGTVSVIRDGQKVATRQPGEFIGEISMIDMRPRTASAVADGPVRCLVLPNQALRELVMQDPRVAWSLLTTLATRLRDIDDPTT